MFSVIASVLALLPRVSENARNSAMIAIMSAICLFTPPACSALSACSNFSCASMAYPSSEAPTLPPPHAGEEQSGDKLCKCCDQVQENTIMRPICPRSGRRTRMGAAVNLHEPIGIDRGIDLRGRQRRMAEQFLDRAQIAAARQEVCRKGMPQRVGCCGFRQVERAAQTCHHELDDARRQR